MLIYEIVFEAPLTEEIPTHLEKVVVIAKNQEQANAYRNLARGREVSVTQLASDQPDLLPLLIDLNAVEAEKAKQRTDRGNNSAQVH